jgi:GxxExxY protein
MFLAEHADTLAEAQSTQRIPEVTENQLGQAIISEAIQLHRELGPGLLESVYEILLAEQLRQRGMHVERQVAIPVEHRGIRFADAFRADLVVDRKVILVVDRKVILEVKCVEKTNNAHRKQVLTYLRLSRMKLGYVLNFGEDVMSRGIVRVVNGLVETE